MANLSVEDKAKGRRIITQFFRTMPGVQKSLMTIFEKDGYEGVFRVQNILYPDNAGAIDSTDTLRKGLSMILQHIYGMPVEDKEGYFQEIVKCKTANQVVRKEKETLINYFYADFADLRDYLKDILLGDVEMRLISMLCQRFLGQEDKVTDMRAFKNQIRNVREALAEQISSGMKEEELIGIIKEKQAELDAAPAPQAPAQAEEAAEAARTGSDAAAAPDHAAEKKRIITTTLGDEKYGALRELLLKNVLSDPNFVVFQVYLDNLLTPATRLLTTDLNTFSQGVQKIKEFRDQLEHELAS